LQKNRREGAERMKRGCMEINSPVLKECPGYIFKEVFDVFGNY
jgi:hypothetical protein